MASSLIGAVLDGKFQIEKALASGASGDVYEAIHLGLGSKVAVKVLRPGNPQTADARRKRFVREARIAARIQSEYVVRVFDVVAPEKGPIYIVMELLEGETLAARVRRTGAMPAPDAVGYVLQTARPLAAMHDLGIVHRDVKPSNIFLARRAEGGERLKLLDFGVAAWQPPVSKAKGDSAITRSDVLVGTPRYMAPEQVAAAKDVDARADVWALGVTLYELLAGRPPFDGQTLLALLNQIERQHPPPLEELRPELPPDLARVVHRCLAKDPALRPADARSLAEALGPFGGGAWHGEAATEDALDLSLSDDGVEVVHEELAPTPSSSAARAARRRARAVAAAITAAAATLAMLWIRPWEHRSPVEGPAPRPSAGGQGDGPRVTVHETADVAPIATSIPSPDGAPTPGARRVLPARRGSSESAGRAVGGSLNPPKSPTRPAPGRVPPVRPPVEDDDRIE